MLTASGNRFGFTLMELLIVLAISIGLLGIVITSFSSLRRYDATQNDAHLIVITLAQARDQTLSSQNANQYGVHFASSTVTLFAGSTYNASDSTNQVTSLNSADTISSINLTGGGTDVVFSRLSGETSQNGTVTVTSNVGTNSRTVTIYKTGLAESN